MSGDKDDQGPLVRSKDKDGLPGFHSGGNWAKGAGPVADVKDAVDAWNTKDKDWIDVAFKSATAGLSVAAAAFDPLAAVISLGVGWVIEHCKPFTALLDEVAGDPDDLTAYAETWKNVGTKLQETNQHYGDAIFRELTSWNDMAGTTYITITAGTISGAIEAAEGSAGALAKMGEILAKLVDELHNGVRNLISDGVGQVAAKVIKAWATGGLSVAVDGPGIAAVVAKWVAKIKNFIRAVVLICERIRVACKTIAGKVEVVSGWVDKASKLKDAGGLTFG